jgi:hypothetical protein
VVKPVCFFFIAFIRGSISLLFLAVVDLELGFGAGPRRRMNQTAAGILL